MKRLAWIPGKRREKGRSTEQFEISDCVCVLKNQTYVCLFWAFMVSPSSMIFDVY